MTSPSASARSWTRWPLARQLPLLTTLIVVVMMALTLTLTYRAMVQARAEAMHARLSTIIRTMIESSIASTKARNLVTDKAGTDPALASALSGPSTAESNDPALLSAIDAFRVPNDSGLPIELLTLDGRRVAHTGRYLPGDTVASLAPEMRSLSGKPVTRVPADPNLIDSTTPGALYSVNGRVYLWSLIPIRANKARIGFIAQQRAIVGNPNTKHLIDGLVGSDATVFIRNVHDNFWSSIDGRPARPPQRRDSTSSGFIEYRDGHAAQMGFESQVGKLPYIFTIEVPNDVIVEEPRSTLRGIFLISLAILIVGAATAWALALRITKPLRELTVATEAIARGDYHRRVELSRAMPDEVERLGASFNRMAAQVDASQGELASQVEQAIAVSEELEQANDRLKEITVDAEEARDAAVKANQAKSDFLAVMSHELRTPLNAIGGYADIMKLGIYGKLNDQQNNALTRIARSQETLLALINDVLNFAKLEAGEVRYAITNVPVAPAIAVLEDLVGPQLRDKHMTYTVQECPPTLAVRADSEKLQQILINLLSNAIKYTNDGGRIEVHCDADDRSVHIHVTDSGIGIPTDRIDRIFDPFIQVGRALNRPHEGVGLGLSISRDLAQAMGGSLVVTSELGVGSTFTLTLERAA